MENIAAIIALICALVISVDLHRMQEEGLHVACKPQGLPFSALLARQVIHQFHTSSARRQFRFSPYTGDFVTFFGEKFIVQKALVLSATAAALYKAISIMCTCAQGEPPRVAQCLACA
jgi:hypothetical protein